MRQCQRISRCRQQGGIKIARRKINNLRYADGTTPMAENEEELKILLMRVEEESEKAGLKLNTKNKNKTRSSLDTNRRGKRRSRDRFPFLGLQKSLQTVTAAMKLKDTCSLEEKEQT